MKLQQQFWKHEIWVWLCMCIVSFVLLWLPGCTVETDGEAITEPSSTVSTVPPAETTSKMESLLDQGATWDACAFALPGQIMNAEYMQFADGNLWVTNEILSENRITWYRLSAEGEICCSKSLPVLVSDTVWVSAVAYSEQNLWFCSSECTLGDDAGITSISNDLICVDQDGTIVRRIVLAELGINPELCVVPETMLIMKDQSLLVAIDSYVFLFSSDGELLHSAIFHSTIQSMARGLDGNAYLICDGTEEVYRFAMDTGAIETAAMKPEGTYMLADGIAPYSVLAMTSTSCIGINGSVATTLIRWADCNIMDGMVCSVAVMEDNRLAVSYQDLFLKTTRISLLTLAVQEAPAEIRTLTIATADPMGLSTLGTAAVRELQAERDDVQVEIKTYGTTQELVLDLIAGTPVDVICLGEISGSKLAARGYLADLYHLIEPGILAENYKKVFQENGHLYELSLGFAYRGWLASSFLGLQGTLEPEVLSQVELPTETYLMKGYSPQQFLSYYLQESLSSYVDWDNFECSFDDPSFADLLEVCRIKIDAGDSGGYSENDVLSGESLLGIATTIWGIEEFEERLKLCAEEGIETAVLSGYQGGYLYTASEDCYAVYSNAINPDLAAAFFEILLSPPYQTAVCTTGQFPVTAAMLDVALVEASKETVAMIDAADHHPEYDEEVFSIVFEEAPACFAGDKTAEECAYLIQSRVSILLAEMR